MSKLQISPYTGRPVKMVKMFMFVFPEDKAKIFNEAKKAEYNGSASEVIRQLIKTI